MAIYFIKVEVNSITGKSGPKHTLLTDGHGTSLTARAAKFACGAFAQGSTPTVNSRYDIKAKNEKDGVTISFSATCTFAGETSEFRR